ncbi:hypothetical protein DPMN_180796 [Dreissena polymorpha]|uniref:Uncharacterized protein n=1 Tax=Dreissena polymorpha TaxID=45954 RepID=A0A9D4DEZ6_DREPO|nr:hypothetical protein DPMN_180796 [Dreissena polymorpha]
MNVTDSFSYLNVGISKVFIDISVCSNRFFGPEVRREYYRVRLATTAGRPGEAA